MEANNMKTIIVLGVTGTGKTTFLLNLLPQNDASSPSSPSVFNIAAGSKLCTKVIQKYEIKSLMGAAEKYTFYDTPGVFGAEMDFITWMEEIKKVTSFDAVIWVIDITKRSLALDCILSSSFMTLIENFNLDDLILVFTHCDSLQRDPAAPADDDPTPIQVAQEWIKVLNQRLERLGMKKIDANKFILSGETDYQAKLLRVLQQQATAGEDQKKKKEKLEIKSEVDLKEISKSILDEIIPGVRDEFLLSVLSQQKVKFNNKMGFHGKICNIRCLNKSKNSKHVYLDGVTQDGHLQLVKGTMEPFTGTKWRLELLEDETYAIRSMGTFKNLQHLYIDGVQQNGRVQLVSACQFPYSGTHWILEPVEEGYSFKCNGHHADDRYVYLEGDTETGCIRLAPMTSEEYTGTHWAIEFC